MQADLSKKDEQFREFSLNGPMWRVVLYVGFPLALYESLNQLFKILDTMMASHIGASAVSAVAYLSQINMMISAVGTGLAVGASIKVSQAYGAGDFMLVKKRVSTMFAMCGALGIAILLVLVPFTPEYLAIERARGNSKRILILNTAVIVVKLGLTAWFVYGLDGGINMISCATIISQSFLLLAACINMNQKGNAFGFSLRAISIKKEVICPMLTLSFPVIVERIAFAVGKVIVNSMSTVYGSWTVGALGISNNIGGITTNPQNGFQEGGSSIISQNLGAGRPKRALLAYRWVLYIDMLIGLVIMTASLLCLNQLAGLFAGDNAEFAEMIKQIYRFEAVGAIPLGVNAAVMALLYGFGKTRVTLVMNFCRVFLFRVPVLWALQQFTDLGNVSAGIVMAVSNVASGVLAAVVGVIEIRRICNTYDVRYFGVERKN